jgi:hypothetical protein
MEKNLIAEKLEIKKFDETLYYGLIPTTKEDFKYLEENNFKYIISFSIFIFPSNVSKCDDIFYYKYKIIGIEYDCFKTLKSPEDFYISFFDVENKYELEKVISNIEDFKKENKKVYLTEKSNDLSIKGNYFLSFLFFFLNFKVLN